MLSALFGILTSFAAAAGNLLTHFGSFAATRCICPFFRFTAAAQRPRPLFWFTAAAAACHSNTCRRNTAAAGTAAAASFFSDDTAKRSCKPDGNPANYHIIQKTHVSPSLYDFPNQAVRKTDSVPDKSRRKPAMRLHTAEAPLLPPLFAIQALCGPLQSQPHTGYTAA